MQHSIARIAVLVALALPSASAQHLAPALPQAPLELHGVSPEQCATLAALCKVWGFLKYHHRRVTGGDLDWDGELFRMLPRVLEGSDRAACNAVLLAWCKEVGSRCPAIPARK